MRIVKISDKGEAIRQYEVKATTSRTVDTTEATTTEDEVLIDFEALTNVETFKSVEKSTTVKTPTYVGTSSTHVGESSSPLMQKIQQLNDMFYEIDYEANPIPGVGLYKQKAEVIIEEGNEGVASVFKEMRQIRPRAISKPNLTRQVNIYSNYYFESQVNSRQFYEQAKFMENFTDEYSGTPTLFRYFPVYQGMSDNQLRRYFSWRTKVRQGTIENVDPSYAFIYVYELLHNIGVSDINEGLEQLIAFWKSFRVFTAHLDKYIHKWIKDYCIFYDIPGSFRSIIKEYDLVEEYPDIMKTTTEYSIYMNLSSYDITKSKFYTDEHIEIIEGSFCKVIDNLRKYFSENGRELLDSVFEFNNKFEWEPFRDAVFFKYFKETAYRYNEFSKTSSYTCKNDEWVVSEKHPSDSSKRFISYVVKRLESELRQITGYKNRITAVLAEQTTPFLVRYKIDKKTIDNIIIRSINEYYRIKNRVVVTVDDTALTRIRHEAYQTQERLIVEDRVASVSDDIEIIVESELVNQEVNDAPLEDIGLSSQEIAALKILLDKKEDIKAYATANGIMIEVLVDNINEKTFDAYGDSFIDEEFNLYEEYLDVVRSIVE